MEVLDYAVKLMVCAECKAHKNDNDFESWYEGNANKCQINHKGSSGSMEAVGAVEIFSRSIATRQLKYTEFVRDGDSSCYGKVAEEMNKNYDDKYVVVKEECVGHAQKKNGKCTDRIQKVNERKDPI